MRKANTAASMEGAGAINQFSGLDQIGTAGLGYAAGIADDKKFNKLMSADPNVAAAMAGSSLKKRGY